MISVVVPIYNEAKYIEACARSIAAQDYPKDDLEVIFVDGMSNDGTREILAGLMQEYPWMRMEDNPQQIVPPAMNIGIHAAKGDTIVRMDAHAAFPANYLTELVKQQAALHADNVGGVCRALPANDSPICKSIAAALSSSFGMGNSYFRIGTDEIRPVDTVPFGCFHRTLFDKIGYFDEQLIRNQDDEFNGRIIKHGGRIYLLPHLVIDYYTRDSIQKVWSMFYQYGLFKPLVNRKLGGPATTRQFAPAFFVLALFFGILLAPWSPWIAVLLALMVLLYLILAFSTSIRTASRENCRPMTFQMPLIFFIIHADYGIGYLHGIFKLLTNSSFKVKSKR